MRISKELAPATFVMEKLPDLQFGSQRASVVNSSLRLEDKCPSSYSHVREVPVHSVFVLFKPSMETEDHPCKKVSLLY